MLTFLSWQHDLHLPSLVRKSLDRIAERVLYRDISDLPASRAMRLLLSLANVPATPCELVSQGPLAGFHQKQSSVRARVAHSQGAHATAGLPRLRSLRVEVSVRENRHCTIMWIFPRDALFRLRSFATSIRYVLYHVVHQSAVIEWELDDRPRFGRIPCPSQRSVASRCEAYPHRFLSCSHTSMPSTQYTLFWILLARYTPICLANPHHFLADRIDRAPQVIAVTRGRHFSLVVL